LEKVFDKKSSRYFSANERYQIVSEWYQQDSAIPSTTYINTCRSVSG